MSLVISRHRPIIHVVNSVYVLYCLFRKEEEGGVEKEGGVEEGETRRPWGGGKGTKCDSSISCNSPFDQITFMMKRI